MYHFIFIFILGVHAIIHIMGFAKAFQLGKESQITQTVSKPAGILWLFAAAIFLVDIFLFMISNSYWPLLAMGGVILSQLLIFSVWKDARAGTAANLIIFLVSISAYGDMIFKKHTTSEIKKYVFTNSGQTNNIITPKDISYLPIPVQKWLEFSGVTGKPPLQIVRIEQRGSMRTRPGGNWMDFTSEQYFNTNQPAFVWAARVNLVDPLFMNGCDRFQNGQGSMKIKLLSLVDIVDEKQNEKINSGTMLRFLGEICWFPDAALRNYISWEAVNETSSKATMNYKGTVVSGIFHFSNQGKLISYEANRYYGAGKKSRLEKWLIEIKEFKDFDGYRLPSRCEVTWKLKEGDFNWLNLELMAWDKNPAVLE